MSVKGSGRTDFRPDFDWFRENAMDANVIYETDGYRTFPDSDETSGAI
jgi:predicted metal-dependent peptidase